MYLEGPAGFVHAISTDENVGGASGFIQTSHLRLIGSPKRSPPQMTTSGAKSTRKETSGTSLSHSPSTVQRLADHFVCLSPNPIPYGGSVTTASTGPSVGRMSRQSPRYSVASPMRTGSFTV